MADDPKLTSTVRSATSLLKSKALLPIWLLMGTDSVYQSCSTLHLLMTAKENLEFAPKVFAYTGSALTLAFGVARLTLMIKGASGIYELPRSPNGKVFDFLMPPEDAEYRALAMEIAFEQWRARYSLPVTWLLYGIHTVSTVALYYVDRIKRGK